MDEGEEAEDIPAPLTDPSGELLRPPTSPSR